MRARILFVESSPDIAGAIALMLESHLFAITRTDDDRRAAERIASEHFDVLVVEIKAHPENSGLRFLRQIQDEKPHLLQRVVAISSAPEESMRKELETIGVCDIVLKPVHETEILEAVLECLDSTPAAVQ
jgi:DNA-binding response OmpR family regulator